MNPFDEAPARPHQPSEPTLKLGGQNLGRRPVAVGQAQKGSESGFVFGQKTTAGGPVNKYGIGMGRGGAAVVGSQGPRSRPTAGHSGGGGGVAPNPHTHSNSPANHGHGHSPAANSGGGGDKKSSHGHTHGNGKPCPSHGAKAQRRRRVRGAMALACIVGLPLLLLALHALPDGSRSRRLFFNDRCGGSPNSAKVLVLSVSESPGNTRCSREGFGVLAAWIADRPNLRLDGVVVSQLGDEPRQLSAALVSLGHAVHPLPVYSVAASAHHSLSLTLATTLHSNAVSLRDKLFIAGMDEDASEVSIEDIVKYVGTKDVYTELDASVRYIDNAATVLVTHSPQVPHIEAMYSDVSGIGSRLIAHIITEGKQEPFRETIGNTMLIYPGDFCEGHITIVELCRADKSERFGVCGANQHLVDMRTEDEAARRMGHDSKLQNDRP